MKYGYLWGYNRFFMVPSVSSHPSGLWCHSPGTGLSTWKLGYTWVHYIIQNLAKKNAIIHNMIVSSVVFGTSFRILGVLITDEILDPTISIDFGVRYSRV